MVLKAELHVHIEGTARPELVRRLAAKHQIRLDGLFDETGSYRWRDFVEFLSAYDHAASVFRTPEDYRALAYEYQMAAAREGVIYDEMFASPDHGVASGLSERAYLEALAQGIQDAEAEAGIVGRIVVVGVRHYGAASVRRAAEIAVSCGIPEVVGFGLAGNEASGTVQDFAPAFAIAREAGLGLTAHAGEVIGAESVRAALDHWGVTRIGHGVRAVEDADLVRRLAAEGVVLEVSPGSNVALGVFASRTAHPFDQLRRAGVPVTLASDDPPFFWTSIGAEYDETARIHGLDAAEMTGITRTALDAAFCDPATRARLLARLDASSPGIGRA